MTTRSKFLFVFIGDDRVGKTTIQKLLINKLCGVGYESLPTNRFFDINHPEIKRKYRDISFISRSYQEKIAEYKTVENYFQNYFQDKDIAFISSHFVVADIEEMIRQGHARFYNVYGVFFSNAIAMNPAINADISLLGWDERLVVDNPVIPNVDPKIWDDQVYRQLGKIAESIVDFIINRTSIS